MNLVEISEMLKGVPDTYLAKHVNSPDGTVPQYLALAELQRRQDMRARFSQQAPQTTVAEDATKGIATEAQMGAPSGAPMGAPSGAPMGAPMEAPVQGFKEGGIVGERQRRLEKLKKDMAAGNRFEQVYTGDYFSKPLDSLLKVVGWRPTDRDKSLYSEYRKDVSRTDADVTKKLNEQAKINAAALAAAKARQAAAPMLPPPDENQMELQRQYDEMMAIQAGKGPSLEEMSAREAASRKAFEEQQFNDMMEYFKDKPITEMRARSIRPDPETGKLPPGYEEYESEDDYGKAEAIKRGAIGGYRDGGPVKEKDAIDRFLDKISQFESKGDPNARPVYKGEVLSSASGLYQFTEGTRNRIDRKYGLDPNDRSPETERKRARYMTQETVDRLEGENFPVTGGSLYGGHLLGQDGVIEFMRAYRDDPNARAQDVFAADIIRKNPAIFDSKVKGELTPNTNKSLAQIMAKLDSVGGSASRTPASDEDMNMGIASRVAAMADRGGTGEYEDMNLGAALAVAELLQDSKLRKPKKRTMQARAEPPNFFYNPMFAGSAPGFSGGGAVKGYSGADGQSRVVQQNEPYTSDLDLALTFQSPEALWAYERRRSELENYGKSGAEFADAIKNADPLGSMKRNLDLAGNVLKKIGERPVGPYGENAAEMAEKGISGFVNLGLQQEQANLAAQAAQKARAAASASQANQDQFDSLATEFLNDIKGSRSSKQDMRDMAILQAGLGMMAGTSPYFGVNFGQGAMAGLDAYRQAQAQNQALNSEAFRGIMAAKGFGLDERRVKAAERAQEAETEYRNKMLEYQQNRLSAMLKSDVVKKSGLDPSVSVAIIKGIQEKELERGQAYTAQEFNEEFMRQANAPLAYGGSGGVGIEVADE